MLKSIKVHKLIQKARNAGFKYGIIYIRKNNFILLMYVTEY